MLDMGQRGKKWHMCAKLSGRFLGQFAEKAYFCG